MMKKREFSLPTNINQFIQEKLKQLGFSFNDKVIVDYILEISDSYHKRNYFDFWQQPQYMAAYLCYFFPLNYIRNLAVIEELKTVHFPLKHKDIVDFGSGCGTSLMALEGSGLIFENITAVESSTQARDFLKQLSLKGNATVTGKMPVKNQFPLIWCSYSINEIANSSFLLDAENIVIVEPSTSYDSHQLIELRSSFIDQGFYPWAPCTHQQACPMGSSKKDWCHDRVSFNPPEWFVELEKKLPMKNKTLTFSYLALSKQKPQYKENQARVIGDTLYEKGKVRQMVCRNSEREFLSWLKKQGEAPQIPHGHLIKVPADFKKVSNELRCSVLLEDFVPEKHSDS